MKTITVRELKELLEYQEDDMKVIFTTSYGDRGDTPQALALVGEIEPVTVVESAYSTSGYAIEEDPDDVHYNPYLVIR
jgi:hypothetical protein